MFCLHRQILYWFGCTLDPRVCLYWCLGADNIPVLSVSVFDLERERERERVVLERVCGDQQRRRLVAARSVQAVLIVCVCAQLAP